MSFMDERRRMLMAALSQANPYPEYTYSGNAQFLDDGDGNWRIKFLSSGDFKLLNGSFDVDIFLVGSGASGEKATSGSGGGGGGGGYTKTVRNINLKKGTVCPVVVANAPAGGMGGAHDGWPSSFTVGSNIYTAEGGKCPSTTSRGGNGGSGGGGGGSMGLGFAGGSDGSNGVGGSYGIGQRTTTREFGETTGELYAGGGSGGSRGGSSSVGTAGGAGGGGTGGAGYGVAYLVGGGATANTGGGGGGGGTNGNQVGWPGGGGTGIVIIRNARGG